MMRIYLSTWLEKSQKEALDKIRNEARLLSFYFLFIDNKSGEDPYIQRKREERTINENTPQRMEW